MGGAEPELPGLKGIQALTAFLPVFESADFEFGELRGGEKTDGGAATMPHYVLSEQARRFVKAVYAYGFIRRFDWPGWQDEARRYVEEPSLLEGADLETLCRLLTVHVRKERFCDGHLADMFRCGHLARLIRRLAELRPW